MHETNSKHRKSKLPTFLACLSHPCRRLQSQYLRQIATTGFVRRFQGATFSRENIPLKTFTKMFFDLLLWQENHNAITVEKTAIIFFISTGIFASEPMTLREIDHVPFFVEHAQTFFAGERPGVPIFPAHDKRDPGDEVDVRREGHLYEVFLVLANTRLI